MVEMRVKGGALLTPLTKYPCKIAVPRTRDLWNFGYHLECQRSIKIRTLDGIFFEK